MVCQINLGMIYGEVVGYRVHLRPNLSAVTVKIGNRNIKITVDSRQARFIMKEYPVGSLVELKFDGQWRIVSRDVSPELDIAGLAAGPF